MSKNKHHDAAPAVVVETVFVETAPPAATPSFKHTKKLALVGDYKPESAITWLIDKNPRMQGRATFDRFQKYFGTNTVKAYTEAGGTKGDLLWDLRSGYLSIEGVTLGGELAVRKPKVPPVPKAKKEKAAKSEGKTLDVEAIEAAVQEETIA